MKIRRKTIFIYAGVILMAWVIVGLGSASDNRRPVTELKAMLVNAENNHFLNIKDIEKVVRDIQGRPIVEVPRGDVKIYEIESSLEKNPYVKEAEAYREMSGAVVVKMELRKPMARVMHQDGTGFYLDEDFHLVDLTPRFSANVPLVRGIEAKDVFPRDSSARAFQDQMRQFLNYVHRSEFLRAQISEIVVTPKRKLLLYPEVGSAIIEFGRPDQVARKFSDLEFFYRRVLNYQGWETYRRISLEFKDQIVAKK